MYHTATLSYGEVTVLKKNAQSFDQIITLTYVHMDNFVLVFLYILIIYF